MQDFIDNQMGNILSGFQGHLSKLQNLKVLKGSAFSGGNIPNYSNSILEEYYFLRYLPAYMCEYKEIYDEIIISDFLENQPNILSIGCGAGVDLWAAKLSFGDMQEFKYTGIDKVNWKYSNNLNLKNAVFKIEDVSNLNQIDSDINIINFPKSIGELGGSAINNLNKLFRTEQLAEKLVLAISMRKSYASSDINKFKNLVDVLTIKQGYKVQEEFFYDSQINQYGAYDSLAWKYGIQYPEHIKSFLRSLENSCKLYQKNHCNHCVSDCPTVLNRNPITSESQVVYKIVYLEK